MDARPHSSSTVISKVLWTFLNNEWGGKATDHFLWEQTHKAHKKDPSFSADQELVIEGAFQGTLLALDLRKPENQQIKLK